MSGGARGIDAAAHRGALRAGGVTTAVLGSGLASIYPEEHGPLFDMIVAGKGAIVSEFAPRVPPRPGHFPRRNRIVAGLCVGVLVIEAARRSGALITARLAVDDLSRDAMAVPGAIDSFVSVGCHQAIRDGWATLVTTPEEVLEALGGADLLLRGAAAVAQGPPASSARMEALHLELAACAKPQRPEMLADLLMRPVAEVLGDLTMLELRGAVRRVGP